MARSLKRQFFSAITQQRAMGQSKRCERAKGEESKATEKIYAYKTYYAMKDVASNFSGWMRDNYPEIREVREIKSDHIEKFLESKRDAGCTKATLQTQASLLDKLGNVSAAAFKTDIDFSSKGFDLTEGRDQIRSIRMTADDWAKIKQEVDPQVASSLGVRVCGEFGLRTSESVKIRPADIGDKYLHIEGAKGGRNRDIEIRTESQREALQMLRDYAEANSRTDHSKILGITDDAQNRWLSRTFSRLEMDRYTEAKTGIHAIRKMYATDRYIEEFEKAYGRAPEVDGDRLEYSRQAWNPVCDELGHGKDRSDLFNRYVVA